MSSPTYPAVGLEEVAHGSMPGSGLPLRTPLTSAEVTVAELAARGLSNIAIAALRDCAPRTVANQLAVVYQKLRVSGRRELRAFLSYRGPSSLPDQAPWPNGTSSPQLSADARPLLARNSSLGKVANPPTRAGARPLSSRELQILVRTGQGQSNKLVAHELGISSSSVSTYLRRARGKAGFEQTEWALSRLPAQSASDP